MKTAASHWSRYGRLLGLALLVVILLQLDLPRLGRILKESRWPFLASALAFIPAILAAQTFRWQVLLRSLGVHYPLKQSCGSIIKASMWGELTPGRVGELFRVGYVVKATGCPPGTALATVVLDRLYDIVLLLGLCAVSALAIMSGPAGDVVMPVLAASIVAIGGIALLAGHRRHLPRLMQPILRWLVPARIRDRASAEAQAFYNAVDHMAPRIHLSALGLSALVWTAKLAAVYCLCLALSINVPIAYAVSVASIGILVGLLPLSISGLGTRDATFILLLGLRGISEEYAVALSFLYLVFGVLSVAIPAGLLYVSETVRTMLPTR